MKKIMVFNLIDCRRHKWWKNWTGIHEIYARATRWHGSSRGCQPTFQLADEHDGWNAEEYQWRGERSVVFNKINVKREPGTEGNMMDQMKSMFEKLENNPQMDELAD